MRRSLFKKFFGTLFLLLMAASILYVPSVLAAGEGATFYVAREDASVKGAGTKENPYRGLKEALANVPDGSTLVLTQNIMERESSAADGFSFTKAVTIDGQGYELSFRGADVFLDKDTSLKNLKLNIIGENRKANIYVQGNKLTLDNIDTKIGDAQADQRPVIYAGGKTQADNIGANPVIILSRGTSEMRFAELVAGNETGESNLPVKIEVSSEFAKVDKGVRSYTTAAVTFESASRNIKSFTGFAGNNNESVSFSNIKSLTTTLAGVDQLSLKGTGTTLTDNTLTTIPATLNIEQGTTLIAPDLQSVGKLSGTGTLALDKDSTLAVDTVADAAKIEMRVWNDIDKEAVLAREFFKAATVEKEPIVVVRYAAEETPVKRTEDGHWISVADSPDPDPDPDPDPQPISVNFDTPQTATLPEGTSLTADWIYAQLSAPEGVVVGKRETLPKSRANTVSKDGKYVGYLWVNNDLVEKIDKATDAGEYSLSVIFTNDTFTNDTDRSSQQEILLKITKQSATTTGPSDEEDKTGHDPKDPQGVGGENTASREQDHKADPSKRNTSRNTAKGFRKGRSYLPQTGDIASASGLVATLGCMFASFALVSKHRKHQ